VLSQAGKADVSETAFVSHVNQDSASVQACRTRSGCAKPHACTRKQCVAGNMTGPDLFVGRLIPLPLDLGYTCSNGTGYDPCIQAMMQPYGCMLCDGAHRAFPIWQSPGVAPCKELQVLVGMQVRRCHEQDGAGCSRVRSGLSGGCVTFTLLQGWCDAPWRSAGS